MHARCAAYQTRIEDLTSKVEGLQSGKSMNGVGSSLLDALPPGSALLDALNDATSPAATWTERKDSIDRKGHAEL